MGAKKTEPSSEVAEVTEDTGATEPEVTEDTGAILVRLVCQFREALEVVQEAFSEIVIETQTDGHPGHARGDGTMLAGEIAKALHARGGRLPGNDGNRLRHVVQTMTKAQLQSDPEMLTRTAQVVQYICECLSTGHKSPHIGEAEILRYGMIFADHMHFSTARVALDEHNLREGNERHMRDMDLVNSNIAKMKARAAASMQPKQITPKQETPQEVANRRFAEDRRPGFGGRPAPNTPQGEYRPDPSGPPGSFIIADAMPSTEGPIGPPPGFGG